MGNEKSCQRSEDGTASLGGYSEGADAPRVERASVQEISHESVLGILQEITQSQEQMKSYMKGLTQELSSQDLSFEQIYARVSDVHPTDPLEKHGLSMVEFDQLLAKYRADPGIQDAVTKVRGSTCSKPSKKVQAITVETIVEVHSFMLTVLERLQVEQSVLKSKVEEHLQVKTSERCYDRKIVVIVVQAIVGAKIQEKFAITSEEIESAVSMQHSKLDRNQEFVNVNMAIGRIMQGILDGWGRASFMRKHGA